MAPDTRSVSFWRRGRPESAPPPPEGTFEAPIVRGGFAVAASPEGDTGASQSTALEGLSFDALRERARRATDAGRLEEALEALDRALALAREGGDQDQVDLAYCNRAAVAITLGEHEGVVASLREVLNRGGSAECCFLAAYNASRTYELSKAFKKGLFYGRIARDRALELGRTDWQVWSLNQIGNCLIGESYFEEANAEYERALELMPPEITVRHAMVLSNLAYGKMVLGDLDRGFDLAFRSLRWFRSLGARAYETQPHLDLCYAYLEKGRVERARRHGRSALELAEASGNQDFIRNALLLLGEVGKASGDLDSADDCFRRLQHQFYPGEAHFVEWMLAVEMRQVVNLRA